MPGLIIFIVLGLIIGSFLNVVILRLHAGKSFVRGRSHCPACHKTLQWYELIPVLSFAVQGGQCRHCHKRISWQYPIVELATGALFGELFWQLRPDLAANAARSWVELVLLLVIAALLLAGGVYDWRWSQLPDHFTLPAVVLALMLLVAQNGSDWHATLMRITAALITVVVFGGLWALSGGRWMGDGDIRLVAVMGLLVAWQELLLAFFIAFDVAAIVALILLATKRKKRTDQIAFGPFLLIGLLIAYFWGVQIVNWYMTLSIHLTS